MSDKYQHEMAVFLLSRARKAQVDVRFDSRDDSFIVRRGPNARRFAEFAQSYGWTLSQHGIRFSYDEYHPEDQEGLAAEQMNVARRLFIRDHDWPGFGLYAVTVPVTLRKDDK